MVSTVTVSTVGVSTVTINCLFSRRMDMQTWRFLFCVEYIPNKHEALAQCWANASCLLGSPWSVNISEPS